MPPPDRRRDPLDPREAAYYAGLALFRSLGGEPMNDTTYPPRPALEGPAVPTDDAPLSGSVVYDASDGPSVEASKYERKHTVKRQVHELGNGQYVVTEETTTTESQSFTFNRER